MLHTSALIDRIIIFICSLTIYLFQTDFNINIVPVLIVIIISCLLTYFENEKVKTGLTIGYAVLSMFAMPLIFFIPLIGYDMVFCNYQIWNTIVLVPMIQFFTNYNPAASTVIIVILSLSVLLKYRTNANIKLHLKFNNLNDTAKELSGQLKKQNRELLEKQDNEVNLATLNERNRIAREIHDSVGHLLSSSILQVGALITINKDERLGNNLGNLKDTLTQAMNSIRSSVHNLYDESIDLYPQIEELIRKFTFCEISLDYQISSNPDKKLKYAFVFIAKEALSNMMKHSNATHASITLREHPAIYQLIIRDNGTVKGYSMENGMGLKNMTDRVQAFNGNINIQTENGFEIFISIPKEEFK